MVRLLVERGAEQRIRVSPQVFLFLIFFLSVQYGSSISDSVRIMSVCSSSHAILAYGLMEINLPVQELMTSDSVGDTEPPLPEEPDEVRGIFASLHCLSSISPLPFCSHPSLLPVFPPLSLSFIPSSLLPPPSLQPPIRTVAIKAVKRWFWVPLVLGGVGTSIFLIFLYMRKRRL